MDQSPFERITTNPIITIDAGNTPASAPISAVFEFEDYIILDTMAYLGSINKIIYTDSTLYIGDFRNTKDIYAYDLNGKLKRKYNINTTQKKEIIVDFSIYEAEQALYVIKDDQSIIYKYDSLGVLEGTIQLPLPASKFAVAQNGDIWVHSLGDQKESRTILTRVQHSSGQKTTNLFFPAACSTPVSGIANLNKNGINNTCLFGALLNDTIYRIAQNGVEPCWLVDFGAQNLPAKSAYKTMAYDEMMTAIGVSKSATGTDILYETDHSIHFCYYAGGQYNSIYYIKNTNKVMKIDKDSDDLFAGNFGHIPYAALPGDRYVFIIEPLSISKSIQKNADHPFLAEIKAKTNALSNPVLLIGKIKI